jgi:hypothetical protein
MEAAELLIASNPAMLEHRKDGKRAATQVGEETLRQIRWAALLLQKSMNPDGPSAGTRPFWTCTFEDIVTLDSWFDKLPITCGQLSIPAKQDCHGSDVAELVAKHQFDAIRQYCESDVVATAMLFACVEGFRSCDPGYAATLISQLGRWIADCGHAHLQAFERIADHAEYNRLALMAMVEEGVSALDHRQHLKSATNVPGPSGVFTPKHSDF